MSETTRLYQLTERQLQVIGMGLGELPHKIARAVVDDIQRQIDAHDDAAKATAPNPQIVKQET